MTYLVLYIGIVFFVWWVYRVGLHEALKILLSVFIPSLLIILFNVKAGRLLFKSPAVGLISIFPTAVLIYRGSKPLVNGVNSWLDRKINDLTENQDVVEAEVISKEDA